MHRERTVTGGFWPGAVRWIAVLLVCVGSAGCGGRETPILVDQLPARVGSEVTVQGRTGVRIRAEEQAGRKVFTLRDDYGAEVWVQTDQDFPMMGRQVVVTGAVSRTPEGRILVTSRRMDYLLKPIGWAQGVVLLLVGLGAVGLTGYVIYRSRRPWGWLLVHNGPSQGKQFDLRGPRVAIGRGLSVHQHVSLDNDLTVLRRHAEIVRAGRRRVFVQVGGEQDLPASYVGTRELRRGDQEELTFPCMIRLGPRTLVQVGLISDAPLPPEQGGPEFTQKWDLPPNWQSRETGPIPRPRPAKDEGRPTS